jgi:hypothetical protein
METAGQALHVGLSAAELADLAALVARPGPFATVYLETDPGVENAAQYSQRRWRAQRETLAAAGAPETALGAIDAVVGDAHLHGAGLGVVADAGGVLHVAHDSEAPPRDRASWAPLPAVVPLLEWRQHQVPHVLVLADRRGADLFATDAVGEHREAAAGGVDPNVEKVAPGGWSQRRYQQRAEVAWEKNAADVAHTLTEIVDRISARVVVVAGDVRAVKALRERLPARVEALVREVEGGRARDGSEVEVARATARLVADAAARDTVAVLEKFREELGQGDRAVEGPDATARALQEARVDMLLLHDEPDDDRRAWFGPAPTVVALRADDVDALDPGDAEIGRLPDVFLRAALGTGASVRVVPGHGGPAGGVGALLRWREPR